jgi:predicted aldo/keto reductase-like oxidoreductase
MEAVESKGIDRGHFRETAELVLSSLGMGTYLGALDSRTDRLVEDALTTSIKSGAVNVIDTAINYRYQKAERSVGRAVNSLISQNSGIERGQVFISTKNGYLAPDADHPHGPDSYVQDELIGKGIISHEDIIDYYLPNPSFSETNQIAWNPYFLECHSISSLGRVGNLQNRWSN